MRYHIMLAAFACGVPALEAQSPQSLTTFRQMHGERELNVDVHVANGGLRFSSARPGELYRANFTYDQAKSVPTSELDTAQNTLQIGLAGRAKVETQVSDELIKVQIGSQKRPERASKSPLKQSASLELSRDVALALSVELDDAEADLDLGGLRVASLDLTSSAGKSIVRFSTPNGTRCHAASVSGGLGELSILNLGNSRCDTLTFEGGLGATTLDFGGTWASNMAVDVTAAAGALTLRLPRDVGIRISMKKVLAAFDPNGLVRRGGAFVTPNYDTAAHHVDITLTTVLGAAKVEWIGK